MDSSRVMLLTGCASGIGRHLTTVLSARGHRVVATDLNEEALSKQAADLGWSRDRVLTRRVDVRSDADWEAAFGAAETAFGPVDVLMNIAGFLHPAWVHELTGRDVDLHLDVNVKGVVHGTHAAAKRMIPRRSGHIVNIGSLASLAPVPGLSLYSASKFAVRGFTLAAATELRDHGVDRRAGFRLVELPRQVTLDDGDLLGLLLRQLRPAAALVELDALVALAHHLLHHLDDLGLADPVGDAAAAGGDVAVLERRQDQPQRRDGALILGLHRLLQLVTQPLAQHGRTPPRFLCGRRR
jgi:NADP-dependent 3-hydroxy acid dehydrogenase YdfG